MPLVGRHYLRPPHPRLTFVTTAIRPSANEAGSAEDAADLGEPQSEIFLAGYLDDPNQLDVAREISFYAQAVFAASQPVIILRIPHHDPANAGDPVFQRRR
jgi:hypothetical protein